MAVECSCLFMIVACCLLFVVCLLMFAVCCFVFVVCWSLLPGVACRGALFVDGSVLFVVWCKLTVDWHVLLFGLLLCAVYGVLCVVCWSFSVVWCVCVARCLTCVACYLMPFVC